MSTSSNCGCGCGTSTTPCSNPIAELPRYYPRQLITPDDLTLEQNYFRDRLRRHNRLLHGWGVVCGAMVCPACTTNSAGVTAPVPWNVSVQTGYILGPYGDEIILDCVRTVDVRTSGVTGVTGETCIDAPDPWCTQVYSAPTTTSTTVYIAVQYQQTMMRPVRVQPAGCGCNDSTCEYSRWHDGYQIGVLQTCPCGSQPPVIQSLQPGPSGGTVIANLPGGDVQAGLGIAYPTSSSPTANCNDCPDCSCGPWVGLAMVQYDQNGSITCIDNCICRRMVASLSQMARPCKCATLSVTNLNPGSTPVQVGATNVPMTVVGTGFACGTTAKFAATDPFTVMQTQLQNAQTLLLTVAVSATAAAGTVSPTLTVMNLDGTSASPTTAPQITITAASTPAPPTGVAAQTQMASKAVKSSPPKSSKH
jgi:hypothetical protein